MPSCFSVAKQIQTVTTSLVTEYVTLRLLLFPLMKQIIAGICNKILSSRTIEAGYSEYCFSVPIHRSSLSESGFPYLAVYVLNLPRETFLIPIINVKKG